MYKNQKILILGMARSGYEVAKLLHDYNNEIIITDTKEQDKTNVEELTNLGIKVIITSEQADILDATFSCLVKNPGIKYDNPVVVKAKELGINIVNEVEVAYSFMNKEVNIIGVTGSNGKTTTSTLIYNFLKEEKEKVYFGGNVGIPLSKFVRDIEKDSYLVLEISDHQLCDMYNFRTNVSVLTNVTPTHLDFHPSYDVYKSMKKRIFNNHTGSNYAIINIDNEESKNITEDIPSTKIYFGSSIKAMAYYDDEAVYYNNEEIIKIKDILLKGKHNYENITAAICAVKIYGVSNEAIRKVLLEFKGVEHRLEFVKEYNGISFYNDSKATNCVSTNIALKSFNKKIILLLGGTDRGHSFYDLKDNLKNVKYIFCYGETKDRIELFANDVGIMCFKFNTLKDCMYKIKDIMKKDDIVLLSPACASWDQYSSFEDRGKEFKNLVEEITSE